MLRRMCIYSVVWLVMLFTADDDRVTVYYISSKYY
jgi:hypothetical protein